MLRKSSVSIVLIVFVGACQLAAIAAEPPTRTIDLTVTDDNEVLANGKHEFTIDELPRRMTRAAQHFEASGVPLKEVAVRIVGEKNATYAQVKTVNRICQQCGFENYLASFDREYPLAIPLAAPVRAAKDRELVLLRLRAKEGGSLATIRLNDRQLATMDELQREIIKILGDERGPSSLAEITQLNIHADDALLWEHIGQAFAAASGYRSARDDYVSLIETIRLVPTLRRDVVEELVELEIVEPKKLEMTFGPDDPIKTAPVSPALADPLPMPKLRLDTRQPEQRKALTKKYGGNDASEAAVAAGLKWIASRQARDGGWNFDHNKSINPVPCPNPGTADKARNGATGMALLPFLGAGQTHAEGAYRKQVHAGLAYLIKNMKVRERTGSWHEAEGNMYAHGYAAVVMCDAYATTRDKELLAPAQMAVGFIAASQDQVGGGWRYHPKQAGDTSASTPQIVALTKARQGEILVPKNTLLGATKFLDSVQKDATGSRYGYTIPGEGMATTAMGLHCRLYLGWQHDNEGLQQGVEFLDKTGPSESDMYFNYYATQVMFQYGGEPWQRWNHKLRDQLINSQDKAGATAGSWFFKAGDHGSDRGGRLYCTALSCLILETYYREPRFLEE